MFFPIIKTNPPPPSFDVQKDPLDVQKDPLDVQKDPLLSKNNDISGSRGFPGASMKSFLRRAFNQFVYFSNSEEQKCFIQVSILRKSGNYLCIFDTIRVLISNLKRLS
jgi:hypothetical protein